MTDKEIIQKWKQGLSKNNLAKIYKREYNMQIRNIRFMDITSNYRKCEELVK